MSVYRSPGRDVEVAPPPPPRLRLLVSPLVAPVVYVAASVVAIGLLELLFGEGPVRLVPSIDRAEDVLAASLLLTPIAVVIGIARSVAPRWSGLRRRSRGAYVAAIVLVQLLVSFAGLAALFPLRFRLFDPTLKQTLPAPDGRTAYLYGGGLLGCDWELYVAGPLSPTMGRVVRVSGTRCETPEVRWEGRDPLLLDRDGAPLAPLPFPAFPSLLGGGGC
jgi:hypothetical protein